MRNFQKELDSVLADLDEKVPRLLLHACCGPCSSYVLEYLSKYFEITVLYYNPNISPAEEYEKRISEIRRFIEEYTENGTEKSGRPEHPIHFTEGRYEPEVFFETVKGLEDVPEGGERCFRCYGLRLRAAAKAAKDLGYDYFCTTLSISPLKNAAKLMEIGEELADEYGVRYLPSDFKKRDGYRRSIELSAEFGLYRQNYCGCVFSKRDAPDRAPRRADAPAPGAYEKALQAQIK